MDKMPEKFNVLATYNAEVSRGISHQVEWKLKMAALQDEFHAWIADQARASGAILV